MSVLSDNIFTTDTAKRMLGTVSPIYDDSYVGLWIIEVIAREYDSLHDIIDSFPDQLSPETATWAIELWEQRYNITPDESLTLDERRSAVMAMRGKPRPLSPFVFKQRLYGITGRQSEIDEHIGDYTFGIYIDSHDDMQTVDLKQLIEYINKHKQAHMSYELWFQTQCTVRITVETGYWEFSYAFAGTTDAGTLPETDVLGRVVSPGVRASPQSCGFTYQYGMCGTAVCDAIL